MSQFEFNKLLEKYLEGGCSTAEEYQISEWYEMQNLKELPDLPETQKQAIEKKIWANIKSKTLARKGVMRVLPPQYKKLFWYGAAASVAFLILFFGVQNTPFKNSDSTQIGIKPDVEIKNTSDKNQEIRLEDSSLVVLEPQSTLSYHGHFGDKVRRVYLQGTAFFNIKRDTTKPFLVHTNNITTEVLGTSFKITTHKNSKDVEVAVLTGKVLIYENIISDARNKRSVLLTPNQKVKYSNSDAQLTPEIVENPILLVKKMEQPNLVFEDALLPQVIDTLRKMYNLDIIISNNDLNQCLLTADLNNLTMFTQLDLICKSINARYEVRGIYIFIDGKGCVD
jgi:transmembrane sensor